MAKLFDLRTRGNIRGNIRCLTNRHLPMRSLVATWWQQKWCASMLPLVTRCYLRRVRNQGKSRLNGDRSTGMLRVVAVRRLAV